MFANDFDIGFIAGCVLVDMAFIVEVEEMAVRGRSFSIVKDSLI